MWALCLAALVLVSSLFTAVFRETPDYVVAALVLCAFVAAAVGVLLNWRLDSAHSEALRDPLTGLPNRVLLDDRIEQALRRSRRSGEPFTLIAVDLDGFKDVNDVRGHRAGDAVLKTLARRFEAIVREATRSRGSAATSSSSSRSAPGATSARPRSSAACGNALRRPFRIDGTAVEIDGSIGWAVFPDDGSTARGAARACRRADVRDEAGHDRRVDVAPPRDRRRHRPRRRVGARAERAPRRLPADPRPRHRDAALRRGARFVASCRTAALVPPAEFVPHVERTPLVRELTFLVVADALGSAQQWAEAGHDLGVSVNVPYRLLDDPQFVEGLGDDAARVRPRAAHASPSRWSRPGRAPATQLDEEILARFAALGVRLSLDDAGRAASFAALRVLPLDELKIDAGFVHGLGKSDTDAALVRGMIDIGHALGLAGRRRGRRDAQGVERPRGLGLRLRAGLLRREPADRRRARRVARRALAGSRVIVS